MTGVRVPEDCGKPPSGWTWRPLKSLARLESGHTPSRRVPEWWGGDVPWLALPDIRALDGRVALTTQENTNALGLANSSARLLPKDTVCLSRTASVGFVTVLGVPMATSQDFVNWVCGPELDPWFLANALLASRSYLQNLSSGAIHKTIYMPAVESFMICTPHDIGEQRRIVAALTSRRNVLAAALITIPAEASKVQDAMRVMTNSRLNEIREQHGTRKLAEYADSDDSFRDGPFGSNLKTAHYTANGARVVRLKNIGDGAFLDTDKAFVSLAHYETIKRHNVHKGDVVVACLGDGVRAAGRACVVPDLGGPALVKADCFRVRLPSTHMDPEFLVACLNSEESRRQFNAQLRGATRPRISLSMLKNVIVPAASIDAQKIFVSRSRMEIGVCVTAQRALQAMKADVEALKPAFFRAAFSGAL